MFDWVAVWLYGLMSHYFTTISCSLVVTLMNNNLVTDESSLTLIPNLCFVALKVFTWHGEFFSWKEPTLHLEMRWKERRKRKTCWEKRWRQNHYFKYVAIVSVTIHYVSYLQYTLCTKPKFKTIKVTFFGSFPRLRHCWMKHSSHTTIWLRA